MLSDADHLRLHRWLLTDSVEKVRRSNSLQTQLNVIETFDRLKLLL
jgi:hypothetical protein